MPPKRILIVEDEAIVALDIETRLKEMGYGVAGVVGQADEALALAVAARPDLVLMDIRLKGQMDGIAAADQIRRHCGIPVVFLTAFSEDHTMQRAKVAEPFGFIIKPFEDRELQSSIEMAIYKHQAEQKLRQSERRYAATLTSIGDAVIATDAQGRITFINPMAAKLTGWPGDQAHGRLLAEIFQIANEQTLAPVEDPVAKVLREGKVVGLANHTVLIGRDGSRIPIDDCAAPILDDAGAISGVVLVFQDVTARRRAEQSQARLTAILESTSDLVSTSTPEGRLTYLNRAGRQMAGWGLDEPLEGRVIPDLHPDWALAKIRSEGLPAAAATGIWEGETAILHRDGRQIPVSQVILAHRDPDGALAFYSTIMRDISQRKKAEEALSRSKDMLESIYRAAPTGIGVVSNRILLTVNDRICEMSGYGREELIGRNARILYPSDADYEYVGTEKYRQISQRGTGTVETRWQRRDGRIIDVLLSSTPLDPADLAAGVTFTALEITDRKKAAKKMRRSHQTLLTVLNSIDATIYVADMDSHEVLFMNQYMIDAFGGDLTGRTCHEAFRGQSSPCDHCTNDRLLDADGRPSGVCVWEGQNPITQKWYINHDRAIRWVDGRTVRLQIATDITALKQMEQERNRIADQFVQAQKMESVGRLAGGVAHDFNNMLGVILGHAEMALMGMDPAHPITKTLTDIQKAARRSAELTQQLLAFARKQTVAPKVLDLNDTVAGMLKMLQRLIGEDIGVLWKPGPALWPVKMDPSQIDQILANLCVNARDAIDGVGKLAIETQNAELDASYCALHPGCFPGQYVMLAVSDDGPGMDKDVIDHIFEPFFTTKAVGKGTGLGLATVYGIVRQNDGFINVHSEPGQGSTFKIYLPRFSGPTLSAAVEPEPPLSKGQGETVLLVEDDEGLLAMSKQMLEVLGYSVLSAGTPDEALDQARNHGSPIHLLITDVVMPQMNGRDLARSIRDVRPAIQCLFMSGYTANVIAHHGVLDEGVLFLQKPFSISVLASKVREALDG